MAASVLVSDIASKIMSGVDSAGDVWFSVKVTAKNMSNETKKVNVTLQAIDNDGFELKTETLQGTFEPNEIKILTEKSYYE